MPTRIEWLGEGGLEEVEDWKKNMKKRNDGRNRREDGNRRRV